MRIISKFKDYYDIGLAYGQDPKNVYVRDKVVFKFTDKTKAKPAYIENLLSNEEFSKLLAYNFHIYKNSRNWNREKDIDIVFVLFCGKLYVGIDVTPKNAAYDAPRIFAWNLEQVERGVKRSKDKDIINTWNKKEKENPWYWTRRLSRKNIVKMYDAIDKFNESYSNYLDEIHSLAEAPIIKINKSYWAEDERFRRNEAAFTINPQLKALKFASIVDPYTAFQEISMYMTNIVGLPENEMVEIADKDKIAKRGYNKKSFRHPTKIKGGNK